MDKLQRSSTARLLVRLRHGGKDGLAQRLEKEEAEYVAAAQAEHLAGAALDDLKAARAEAEAKVRSFLPFSSPIFLSSIPPVQVDASR